MGRYADEPLASLEMDHYAGAVFSEPGHNERESRGHAWFARVVRDRISSQRLRVDARSLPSGFGSLLCQLCTTEHRLGPIAGRFGS